MSICLKCHGECSIRLATPNARGGTHETCADCLARWRAAGSKAAVRHKTTGVIGYVDQDGISDYGSFWFTPFDSRHKYNPHAFMKDYTLMPATTVLEGQVTHPCEREVCHDIFNANGYFDLYNVLSALQGKNVRITIEEIPSP